MLQAIPTWWSRMLAPKMGLWEALFRWAMIMISWYPITVGLSDLKCALIWRSNQDSRGIAVRMPNKCHMFKKLAFHHFPTELIGTGPPRIPILGISPFLGSALGGKSGWPKVKVDPEGTTKSNKSLTNLASQKFPSISPFTMWPPSAIYIYIYF